MKTQGFKPFWTAVFSAVFFLAACAQPGNGTNQGEEQSNDRRQVLIVTDMGNITIELYNETPEHRDNFLRLAEEEFYDGILFHRVISGFMIQAGDPHSKDAVPGEPLGSGGPGHTVPAEIVPGLFHHKGALAAARLGDQMNPERRSSGSQFYFVQGRVWSNEELDQMEIDRGIEIGEQEREAYTTIGGTPHLDKAYSVYGRVISGLEVVDRIAATETGERDRPIEDVAIIRMEVIK